MPEPKPSINLRTYALAAVAVRLPDAGILGQEAAEAKYLRGHLRAVDPDGADWARGLPAYLEQPATEDVDLIGLGRGIGLTLPEILSVSLAAAVEGEARVGRALAHVQAPVGGSRPILALLAEVYAEPGRDDLTAIQALADGAAMQSGLLSLAGHEPLPEQTVSVPLHLCLALAGDDAGYPGAMVDLGEVPPIPLPASCVAEAARLAAGLKAVAGQVLIVRTGSNAEGRSVAQAIAAALNRRPLFVEPQPGGDPTSIPGLGPWLRLRDLLPVFCLELAPGERKVLPPLPYYDGPTLVLCGPDGSVESAAGAALSWSLPVPPKVERQALWERAIGAGALADELAAYHRHSSGRIAHLGRLAHFEGVLHGHPAPTREDIAAAAWTGESGGLDALAQALPDPISDAALVAPEPLRRELATLLVRCRARDALVEGLGPSARARYHPGVRALFVGPSGTGKTLAAGWLATQMGLPLYRVDLSAVTSKYIGETEKNLAQLLARAEQSEVILLFDEADSLFGKRTDVKEANDRFANAQTNYLLQRIETYDGITLLTSNNRTRFDAAFSRRLDMVVEFPAPGPEERRALWLAHLGEGHALTPVQINQLAIAADFTGGHIRNAVLTAAAMARWAGRAIAYTDIIEGLAGEYRKLSRPVPGELVSGNSAGS